MPHDRKHERATCLLRCGVSSKNTKAGSHRKRRVTAALQRPLHRGRRPNRRQAKGYLPRLLRLMLSGHGRCSNSCRNRGDAEKKRMRTTSAAAMAQPRIGFSEVSRLASGSAATVCYGDTTPSAPIVPQFFWGTSSGSHFPKLLITGTNWWTHKGSNLGPLPCEGNALPLSYASGNGENQGRQSPRFTKDGPSVSSEQSGRNVAIPIE